MACVAHSLEVATVLKADQGDARSARGVSPRQSVEDLAPVGSQGGIALRHNSRKAAFKKSRPRERQPRSSMAPPQNDDQQLAALMKAAQAGDAMAYTQLLRSVTPRLRGYARHRWPSLTREDIEDVVQDVLLSVHAARATYNPQRPFLPWLFAIAGRRLADHARRHMRRAAQEVQVDELPDPSCDEAEVLGGESHRDPEALRMAAQDLPPKQRIAIEMLKFREMSLKEGSAATGMSIGALKASIHRALPLLRKALTAHQ